MVQTIEKDGVKTQIVLTHHAIERLAEIGVEPETAIHKLKNSRRLKRRLGRQVYKAYKYGKKQHDIDYYYHAPLLYTVSTNLKDEKNITRVVVTVTKRNKNSINKNETLRETF